MLGRSNKKYNIPYRQSYMDPNQRLASVQKYREAQERAGLARGLGTGIGTAAGAGLGALSFLIPGVGPAVGIPAIMGGATLGGGAGTAIGEGIAGQMESEGEEALDPGNEQQMRMMALYDLIRSM